MQTVCVACGLKENNRGLQFCTQLLTYGFQQQYLYTEYMACTLPRGGVCDTELSTKDNNLI